MRFKHFFHNVCQYFTLFYMNFSRIWQRNELWMYQLLSLVTLQDNADSWNAMFGNLITNMKYEINIFENTHWKIFEIDDRNRNKFYYYRCKNILLKCFKPKFNEIEILIRKSVIVVWDIRNLKHLTVYCFNQY